MNSILKGMECKVGPQEEHVDDATCDLCHATEK
jgi:hypothetical protein